MYSSKISVVNIILFFFILVISAKAQNTNKDSLPDLVDEFESTEVLVVVEQMPEFPGGPKALMTYLTNNLKYPQEARKMGLEGRVYIKFIVTKLGKIENVKVIKGIPDGELLEKEAVRVISSMPDWNPGKQEGKAANVYMTLPVNFKLN